MDRRAFLAAVPVVAAAAALARPAKFPRELTLDIDAAQLDVNEFQQLIAPFLRYEPKTRQRGFTHLRMNGTKGTR